MSAVVLFKWTCASCGALQVDMRQLSCSSSGHTSAVVLCGLASPPMLFKWACVKCGAGNSRVVQTDMRQLWRVPSGHASTLMLFKWICVSCGAGNCRVVQTTCVSCGAVQVGMRQLWCRKKQSHFQQTCIS
eukprot:1153961-Pelagomonas_calceolata.AAC.5